MERSVRYSPNSKRNKGGFEADRGRLWHREQSRKERDRIREMEESSRMLSMLYSPFFLMRPHTGQEPTAPKGGDVMAGHLAGYFLKELPRNYNHVNPEASYSSELLGRP